MPGLFFVFTGGKLLPTTKHLLNNSNQSNIAKKQTDTRRSKSTRLVQSKSIKLFFLPFFFAALFSPFCLIILGESAPIDWPTFSGPGGDLSLTNTSPLHKFPSSCWLRRVHKLPHPTPPSSIEFVTCDWTTRTWLKFSNWIHPDKHLGRHIGSWSCERKQRAGLAPGLPTEYMTRRRHLRPLEVEVDSDAEGHRQVEDLLSMEK